MHSASIKRKKFPRSEISSTWGVKIDVTHAKIQQLVTFKTNHKCISSKSLQTNIF